ncbi:MAG: hypothetical protein IPK19_41130 [Chloroflexi bacterium]|nr:hypothetical protein [Chloroflexota bacterium]
MSESSFSADRDLKEAKAMVEGLTSYIQEETLYGHTRGGMFGSGNMPALTIGALLMRLRRLRALEATLSPAQRDQLGQIERLHDSVRSEWRNHYLEKLHREGTSRLKAMNTFFEECTDDPRQCPNIYLPEALRRTIVQEIARMLESLGEEHEELKKAMRRVDGKLRGFTQPNGFLWASELEAIYPADEFWWLYARPPRTDREPRG